MNDNRVHVIESNEYRETRAKLAADPIIQKMAAEIWRDRVTVTTDFMVPALREYQRRGGTIGTHIGGPIEAINALLAEERDFGEMRDELEARIKEAASDSGMSEDEIFHDIAAGYIEMDCPVIQRAEMARCLGVQLRPGVNG